MAHGYGKIEHSLFLILKYLPMVHFNYGVNFARLVMPFLFCLLYTCSASAQIGICASNNQDPPPYPSDGDPPISINEIDVLAPILPNGLCIGDANDPDMDTQGCGTFRFTNLPLGDADCPTYFCFQPRQGCGTATGNVCVWIEGIDAETWDNIGSIDESNGFTRICIASDPTVSTFDITICRPGNGPVSIQDLEVFLPPEIGLPEGQEICTESLPTTIDLTTLEPDGFTGGTWNSTDIAITDPANVPVDGSSVSGDCIFFDYTYDASFLINGSDDPNDGINIEAPCILKDTVKYTIVDDCCFCVNNPVFTGMDNISIPVCNPDVNTDSDGDGIPDFIDEILGDVAVTGDQDCMLSPISYMDTAPITDNCTTSLVRTYSVTTGCGELSGIFRQTISWTTDMVPPTIICPTVTPLEGCDASVITAATTGLDFSAIPVDITGVVVPDLIITDNCDNGGIASVFYQDNIIDGDCPNPITIVERTFTVMDFCGQENTCVQTIEVIRSNPAISIVKQAIDGTDTQVVNLGGTATFEITVSNNGPIDLVNVIIEDPLFMVCNNNVENLAVGESFTYTCSVSDVSASFINTVNVTADGADCACAQAVASDDSSLCWSCRDYL